MASVQKELSQTVYQIAEKPFHVSGDDQQEPAILRGIRGGDK